MNILVENSIQKYSRQQVLLTLIINKNLSLILNDKILK